jgi:hypothetical protein
MVSMQHPGHGPDQSLDLLAGESAPPNVIRALNLGSPASLGRHFVGHAALAAVVESAGADIANNQFSDGSNGAVILCMWRNLH